MTRTDHDRAAPPEPALPEPALPERIAVTVWRTVEPNSGLPIVWVHGHLPDMPFDPDARVALLLDDVVTFWHPLRRLEPIGSAIEVFVPDQPDTSRAAVVLRSASGMRVLHEHTFQPILEPSVCTERPLTPDPVPPPSRAPLRRLARRAAGKVRTGEAFDPRRWKGWSARAVRRVFAPDPQVPVPIPVSVPDPVPAQVSVSIAVPTAEPGEPPRTAYEARVANNDMTPQLRAIYADQARGFAYRPTISILMPVYNVEVRWLRAAVESVRAQVYDRWELCLADDASTKPDLLAYLRSLASDPRVKVAFRPQNGHICHATNTAADLATGEFVAFMDNDDALAPDALYHYVRLLQDHATADLIYSDEDKIDVNDRRYDPYLKPDWSPELFLSYNYVNHFTCLRRSLFDAAGRFRPGVEGAQDYDLLFRVVEQTDRIHHVPRVLYHWRALPTSTAAAAAVKPAMFTAAERAVQDYLARRGVAASTYQPAVAQRLQVPLYQLDFPDRGPFVLILVPVTDDRPLSPDRIAALRERTTYGDYRVVIVDGTTHGVAAPTGCAVRRDPTVSLGELVNGVAADLTAEFLLVFDPSLEVTEPRWLTRLVGYVRLPGVGCTGARIVGTDGVMRQGGIVLNMYDETAPGRAFEGHPVEAVSYYFHAEVARTVAAVSAECLLTRRETFLNLDGFDTAQFHGPLAGVEYGRRLTAQGLRSVFVGGAELRQHGPPPGRDDPREVLALRRKYGRERDGYYHPGLSFRDGYRIESSCPDEPDLPPGMRADVLFAAHGLNAAEGAPRCLYLIADGLARRGRVRSTAYSPLPGPGAAPYENAGIPVHVDALPFVNKLHGAAWEPAEYEAAVNYATRLIADRQPDVVVANTLCNFVMVEAAYRAGVPSVWILHESHAPEHMPAVHSPFALTRCQAAFTLADRVVCVSHDTAKLYAGLNRRHTIEVIHNGLPGHAIEEYVRATTPAAAAVVAGGPAGASGSLPSGPCA